MQSSLIYSAASSSAAAETPVFLGYSWGVSQRQGRRPSMEDFYTARIMPSRKSDTFLSIFDGHGGKAAAKKAAELLPLLITSTPLERGQFQSVEAYEELEEIFKNQKENSGTTAVSVYIKKNDDAESTSPYILEVAWTGDSRAIYVRKDGSIAFETTDHKPTDVSENKRIKDAGGFLMMGRVVNEKLDKALAVTRAIGDYGIKQETKGIVATPEVRKLNVFPRHHFMILASDGVWDVIDNEEAVKIVQDALKNIAPPSPDNVPNETALEAGSSFSTIQAARALRDAAYNRGSKDNVSAMIIEFQWSDS